MPRIVGFFRMSALRLFLTLCASIFVGEVLVVLLLGRLPSLSRWGGVLVDATLLLIALFPILYFAVLRPLKVQIVQRERAERARREFETELRAILDSSAEGILAVDSAGRILHTNRRFGEIWRIPPAVLERGGDRSLLNLVQDQLVDSGAFLAKVQSPHGSGADAAGTISFRDGRTIEHVFVPMRIEGTEVGRVWSFRDISERMQAVEEVQRSKAVLESVTDGTTNAVYVKDVQGRYTMCNAATCGFVGRTREEILGRDDADLFPPDDARAVMESDRRVMAAGVTRTYEEPVTTGGVVRTFLATKGPVRNEGGQVIGVFGISRDIAERKQAEEALRQSELRVRTVLETMSLIGVMLDREGRITLCNDYLLALTGRTREEVMGQDWFTLFLPADVRESVSAIFLRALGDGEIPAHFENEIVTRAGERRLIAWSNTTLWDSSGSVVGVASIGEDISARRLTEEALKQRNRFVESLLEHAPLGFAVNTISDGRPVFVSRSFESIYGLAPGSVQGVDDFFEQVYLDPAFREQMRARIMADMATGDVSRMRWEDIPITTAAGEKKFVTAMNIPLLDQDLMISTVQDVTVRRRAEEARAGLEAQLQQSQKLESVGLLAGGVAHDFNNMLSVILGRAELALLEADESSPFRAGLIEIVAAAVRSADLTRRLLTFARKQAVAPKVMDLNAEVKNSLKMLKRLIREDVVLSWQPASSVWPVRMDPSHLDQVLANLCVNARDAITGVGTAGAGRAGTSGTVTISTANRVLDTAFCLAHADATPGDYVRLTVRDDGVGMSRGVIARLFEPFFTTKPVGGGTGLGLAMVYGAVRQSDGFIAVSSTPGEGATFDIYLPRHQGPAGADTPAAAVPAVLGHETILLVEDELAVLSMATRSLERLGYTVLAASSPTDALRVSAAYAGQIHLLLTDVIMPGMSGRELAAALAPTRPDARTLFMSGYAANVVTGEQVLGGKENFIAKPFATAALAAKVREVLGGA